MATHHLFVVQKVYSHEVSFKELINGLLSNTSFVWTFQTQNDICVHAPILNADLHIWITLSFCLVSELFSKQMLHWGFLELLSMHLNQTMQISILIAYRLLSFPFIEHFNKYRINIIWKHLNMKLEFWEKCMNIQIRWYVSVICMHQKLQ